MLRLLPLLLLPLLVGCATLHPEGRVLSAPLTGEAGPQTAASKVALAPVTAVALLVDTVVVNPVRALPRAIPQAHELTTSALAFPYGALKLGLPDPLAFVIYLPFYTVGMAVSVPAALIWHVAVPGALAGEYRYLPLPPADRPPSYPT